MCRYNGTLVVIGLPPNKELVAYASEFVAYYNRFTTSDSGGWAQFDNFDFSAEYEGDLANVGIAYKQDDGDWESIKSVIIYQLSVIRHNVGDLDPPPTPSTNWWGT